MQRHGGLSENAMKMQRIVSNHYLPKAVIGPNCFVTMLAVEVAHLCLKLVNGLVGNDFGGRSQRNVWAWSMKSTWVGFSVLQLDS